MSPDGLLVLLEVARAKRLADAAAQLRMDGTTVSRRISRLESELQVRLFDRAGAGWLLTEAGQRLLPHAEAVEASVAAAREQLGVDQNLLTGSIRVLAPDGFGAYVIAPGLRFLRRDHPLLSVELSTSTTHDVLSNRDSDVAVTLERPNRRGVEVRRLAQYELRLYGSAEYLRTTGAPATLEDLRRHVLIGYIESLLDVAPLRILHGLLPDSEPQVQTNNITAQHQAARAGVGIALLPSYIGHDDPTLVPVMAETAAWRRDLWLVVPRDLQHLRRVTALVEALSMIASRHDQLWVPPRT